jgi:hypothetical protein
MASVMVVLTLTLAINENLIDGKNQADQKFGNGPPSTVHVIETHRSVIKSASLKIMLFDDSTALRGFGRATTLAKAPVLKGRYSAAQE